MKLPVGYKELEYIRSTGTQGIDTLIRVDFSTKIDMRISMQKVTGNVIVGRAEPSDDADWRFFNYANQFYLDIESSRIIGGSFPNDTVFDLEIGNNYVKSFGEVVISGDAIPITDVEYTIKIFSGSKEFSQGTIYFLNITTSEGLKRAYIPAQEMDTSLIGLYDLVSGTFFTNLVGDPFIAGPEIIYPPEKPLALNASLDGQTVILSWSGAENPESYNIYRNGEFVGSSKTESYVDSDVPYGTYIYEVSTVNRYGESERISTSVTISEPAVDNTLVKKETLVYLLDQNYQPYDVIDVFQSLIWTVRYTKCGDFELYIPATSETISRFHEGDYAMLEESDRLMIIENISLETDAENGDYLVVSGRSLESILDRRIIWGMTVLTGNFQNGIKTLLTRNVISPSIANRAIPNFVFKESDDPRITELTIEAQYFGENLYEEIEKLCTEKNLGFKILPTNNGGFEFLLYFGEDRSYAQDKNPWVVFAPNYENLQSSNYLYSKKDLRNATLVGGQGEGWSRTTVDVTINDSSGLNRREMFTDASGITNDTTDIENDTELTEEEKQEIIATMTAEYQNQLRQKGSEELAKTKITETFDGEIDASIQYVYGRDFYLGDIVQIENAYGMTASTRVSEVVISHDTTGKTVIPTFTVDEKKDGE